MPDISNTNLSPAAPVQTGLLSAEDAALAADRHTASNGLRFSTFGLLDAAHTALAELHRLVGTVPSALADALTGHVYAFVPLALSAARLAGDDSGFSPDDKTLIAPRSTTDLVDKATCHRNSTVDGTEHVFLSTRLHTDRFALAFEFFINIAHNFVDSLDHSPAMPAGEAGQTPSLPPKVSISGDRNPAAAAGPQTGAEPRFSQFSDLVWAQALANVRGETSIDAWEHRGEALGQPRSSNGRHTSTPALGFGTPANRTLDEKARSAYLETAFSDTLAIYLLSLYLDFDYADLRERDYPLLAPTALADRLRLANRLFSPNPGYEFAIRYRRKT